MNVLAAYIQGCSGAVVEHLVHNLKVRRFLPSLCSITFPLHRRKIPRCIKLNKKFRPIWQKLFLLYVRNESAAPGLGSGKSRQALKQCRKLFQGMATIEIDTLERREIITVRGQSYVSRLPKY